MISLVAGLAFAASAQAAPPPTGSVAFLFCGLRPVGQVVVALYGGEASWNAAKAPVRNAKAVVADACLSLNVGDLPPGRYAVMAFQDINSNGKLDTALFGPPVEPYGFSNDARALFGPPAWSQAAFEVRAGETTPQHIHLH